MDTLPGGMDVRGLSQVAVMLLGDAAVRVTVLLGAVALVALVLRRASATARHLVWCLGVCGALALPLLGLVLPAWRLAVLPPASPEARVEPRAPHEPLLLVDARTRPQLQAGVVTLRPGTGGAGLGQGPRVAVVVPLAQAVDAQPALVAAEAPEREAAAPRRGVGGWVLGVWGVGALAVALRLVLARVAVWQLAAHAEPVQDARLLARLTATVRALGISRRVRLLSSEAVALPVTWGVLAPTVLVPHDARGWHDGRVEQVLLHELAHVKRLDALTQLLAQLACAFYWFHPLVWLAERRMRVLREYACDDQVLASGTRASDYARELLEMVRSLGRRDLAHAATLAMARPSQLEERLRAILDPAHSRAALGRARAALLSLGTFAFLLPLAALRPAHAAEPEGVVAEQREAEPRRPRTLPRLSREESSRRGSTYSPEPLSEEAREDSAEEWAGQDAPAREEEGRRGREDVWAGERRGRVEVRSEDVRSGEVRSGDVRSGERRGRDEAWSGTRREEREARQAVPAGTVEEAIARAVRESSSEEELARALGKVLEDDDLDGERERQAFLQATERVREPRRRAELLVRVLREAPITEETGRALLRVARGVADDAALLEVLSWCHKISEDEVMHGPLMNELLQTVAAVDAPRARGKALREVLDEAPISEQTGRTVLRMAAGLGDDREAGAVLARFHDIRERELVRGPLVEDYLEASRRLRSDAEQARALSGLLERGPLPRDPALRALDQARAIGSEDGRRRVVRAAGALQRNDPDVSRAVQVLAQSVRDGDRVLVRGAERAEDGDPGEHSEQGRHRWEWHWSGADGQQRWWSLTPEQRERVREEVRRAREEMKRAQKEMKDAQREALRAERERAREEAERAREEAARAREEARAEAERAREQARAEAERARAEAERAREQTRERRFAEGERRREGREPGEQSEEARARIQAEVERFAKAKESLRAQAERLRAEADRLAAQMRKQVEEIRGRVERELERAGIEDFDLDDALDYEFDVDIDVD